MIQDSPTTPRSVLNVGGNSKEIPIPPHYNGWNHLLLDIDPKGKPDVVCDARELTTLAANRYDAIYCSHNLEHYHQHELPKVLGGFLHLLKDDGFAEIHVPDMQAFCSRRWPTRGWILTIRCTTPRRVPSQSRT